VKIFNKFLTLIFSIGFIPIIPVFIFLFYYYSSSKEDILKFHENISYISATMVENILFDLNKRTQNIEVARSFYKDEDKCLKYILDKNPEFIFISLLDKDGKQKAREGILPLKKLFWYIDISNSLDKFINKKIVIEDIKLIANIPSLTYIYRLENGEILYSVISIKDLFKRIYSQRIGQTGSIYLAGRDGTIFPFENKPPSVNSILLMNLFKKERGNIKKISDREKEYIGSFSKVKNIDLFILTLQSRDEAFRWINFVTFTVIFFILSLLTIFYFISLIIASNITNPINALIDGAYRVAKGKLIKK